MSEPAAVAETHVSVVFFVGEYAYKLKKPVDLGFLDFSTRADRERVCHREVELNRRLTPDVYLGVADIVDTDGSVCDHLVVMRRMPVDRRLSRLVAEHAATVSHIDALAHLLATFHERADVGDHISASATVDAIRANWTQSFDQLRPFVGAVLPEPDAARVEELVSRYLDGRRALFDNRITRGRIRDGHGDLLADDIFMLDDGPRVLDCIEFDDRLRYCDVLADIGFLAMDLEYQGAPALAARLLDRWRELTGETHPHSLAHHYIAFRAYIRGKVACLRLDQGDANAAADARRHLALARSHLERGRVMLVIVGGLPGTGKSTLADGIGAELGWTVLRSDAIRKELAGLPPDAPAGAAFGEGIYAADTTAQAYEELMRRARRALELGESVVLDASWSDAALRAVARHVAIETASELVEIRCEAPDDVAAHRLRTRVRRFGSDATEAVAAAMAAHADAWPTAVVVDTDRSSEDAVGDALRLLPPISSAILDGDTV